jgi:hypothetical protein
MVYRKAFNFSRLNLILCFSKGFGCLDHHKVIAVSKFFYHIATYLTSFDGFLSVHYFGILSESFWGENVLLDDISAPLVW